MQSEALTWLGIALCVAQSGMFSGLNLALFGVTALRLKTLENLGDEKAARVLKVREDSNFALTTILWGNVATNVLLTLLTDSVLAGALGFVFSTFVITFGGEIIPQAYFSRNALKMAGLLTPVLRFYQVVLFPLAKPSAWILDAWLGKESIDYIPEDQVYEALRQHADAPESEIGRFEGRGAANFLALDDVPLSEEGRPVDPESVLRLPHVDHLPVFPTFEASPDDPFLRAVQASEKRWVLIAAEEGPPTLALDADGFLRAALFGREPVDPMAFCHRPVVVADPDMTLDQAIADLTVEPGGEVVQQHLILLWGERKRILTGTDVLGSLLKGIVPAATSPRGLHR